MKTALNNTFEAENISTACGYTKATAATYWKIAKKNLNSQFSILNSI